MKDEEQMMMMIIVIVVAIIGQNLQIQIIVDQLLRNIRRMIRHILVQKVLHHFDHQHHHLIVIVQKLHHLHLSVLAHHYYPFIHLHHISIVVHLLHNLYLMLDIFIGFVNRYIIFLVSHQLKVLIHQVLLYQQVVVQDHLQEKEKEKIDLNIDHASFEKLPTLTFIFLLSHHLVIMIHLIQMYLEVLVVNIF